MNINCIDSKSETDCSKVTEDFFYKIKNFSPKDKEYAKELIQSHFPKLFSDKAEVVLEKFERAASVGISSDFTESDKTILMAQLSSILNICFANIVEEPEQNLYPYSQIKVINFLISCFTIYPIAPIAQLDRVLDFESRGYGFDSCLGRQ